jgi:hypothetical protein
MNRKISTRMCGLEKRTFRLNGGSTPALPVLYRRIKRFDAMDIQISKVVDTENLKLGFCGAVAPYRYIYEEISKDDLVIYARVMGFDSWALEGGTA